MGDSPHLERALALPAALLAQTPVGEQSPKEIRAIVEKALREVRAR